MPTDPSAPHMMKNAMTVDVEDYFQVSAFERYIKREEWNNIPSRVEMNTNKVLDIFSANNVKGTFFTLGLVAEQHPQLIRRIVDEGHELASHGYEHIRVTKQTPKQFKEDVVRTKALLEDLSGKPIKGYRAASYSINNSNLWALDILAETGHLYSSSIYPIKHDLYGIPDAPRFQYHPRENQPIIELPITTLKMFGRTFPCGGGGFFRLYPYMLSKWAIKHVNEKEQQSGMFYFHPWEIDTEQPRQKGLDIKTKTRHYMNLNKMEGRLIKLLKDFSWGRMDEVFLKEH
jgi:polysaccharide deacetylase family protein (PEP-CTERM system associated)